MLLSSISRSLRTLCVRGRSLSSASVSVDESLSGKEYLSIRLKSRPVGLPSREETFDFTTRTVPETLKEGQVLVKNRFLSLDPANRGWMNPTKSYIEPIPLGAVMRGGCISEVISSADPKLNPGDLVSVMTGWEEYTVLDTSRGAQVLANTNAVKSEKDTNSPSAAEIFDSLGLETAIGPLGMTGMTAYFGLLDVGRPRAGETVLVSGAAGAVGSLVGQIAQLGHAREFPGSYPLYKESDAKPNENDESTQLFVEGEGAKRVVGIAGSDEKCAWLVNDLGYDAAINYKDNSVLTSEGSSGPLKSLGKAIRTACPEGVDVFFDNVGGETLNSALTSLNFNGRVVVCGAISQYNATEKPPGPSNYYYLLFQRGRMEGFVVFDYFRRYQEAISWIGKWIKKGDVKYKIHTVEGLENAPEALNMLFEGKNEGKLVLKIDKE